jgi:hypothetical protein
MDIENALNHLADELKVSHPFFGAYEFNEYGAPVLDGSSIFDMGMFLLILEETPKPAHSVALSRLLPVTKLTIKNWLKKIQGDALVVVDSVGSGKTAHYILRDWGVYSKDRYEPFRPYIRLVIQKWRMSENGQS